MRWQGKIIGGLIGLVAGPIGAAFGALLGHQFDQQTDEEAGNGAGGDPAVISAVFFRSAFAVMGCIAKADGRVSEQEIQAARTVMQQMRLSPDQVQAAIRFFTEGKQDQFDWSRTVSDLRRVCGGRHNLLRVFVEIQMRAAIEGGGYQGSARTLIQRIAQMLAISPLELVHMESVLRSQRSHYSAGSRSGRRASPSPAADLAGAYEVLEIQASVTDEEVVKAYRRQMSRHHPDKLVANGLPESMQELAKEKTQQIREAYEALRRHRGM